MRTMRGLTRNKLIKGMLSIFITEFNRTTRPSTGPMVKNSHSLYQESQIINHMNQPLYVVDSNGNDYLLPANNRALDFNNSIEVHIRRNVNETYKGPEGNNDFAGEMEILTINLSNGFNEPVYVPDLNVIVMPEKMRNVVMHPWKSILNAPPQDFLDPTSYINELNGSYSGYFILPIGIKHLTDTVWMEMGGKICSIGVVDEFDRFTPPGITIFWREKKEKLYTVKQYSEDDIKRAMGDILPHDGHSINISLSREALVKAIEEDNPIDVSNVKAGYTVEDVTAIVNEAKEESADEISNLKKEIDNLKEKLKLEKDAKDTAEYAHKNKLKILNSDIDNLKSEVAAQDVAIKKYESILAVETSVLEKGFEKYKYTEDIKEKERVRKHEEKKREEDVAERREIRNYEKDKRDEEEKTNSKIRKNKETISKSQVTKEIASSSSAIAKAATIILPILGGGIGYKLLSSWLAKKATDTLISGFMSAVSLPMIPTLHSVGGGISQWLRVNVWF